MTPLRRRNRNTRRSETLQGCVRTWGAGTSSDQQHLGSLTPLDGTRVLVVEDDVECRELFRTIFEASGARVSTASSAHEGLKAFGAFQPDVLVSDIAMPDEDGYWLVREVLRLARKAGRPIRTLAVTAHTDAHGMRRARAAGFDAFLAKPVDPWELCGVVAGMVRPG